MEYPTPKDYNSETPPPRIIGTEWEVPVQTPTDEYSENFLISSYFDPKNIREVFGSNSVTNMAANGSRPHIDLGGVEYAGPECLGPRQATLAQHAGYYAILGMITNNDKRRGVPAEHCSRIFMHTATSNQVGDSNTLGNHDNFQTSLSRQQIFGEPNPGIRFLDTYDSTRVWDGGGFLAPDGYQFLQKATGIGTGWININSGRTIHGHKTMGIIAADFLDKDTIKLSELGDQFTRAENRVNDIHFDPKQTFLRLATCSLVLRILEQQRHLDDEWTHLLGQDPNRVIKASSKDLTLTESFLYRDGKTRTALDVQESLANIALKLSGLIKLPGDEVLGANLWLQTIDGMRASDIPNGVFDQRIKNFDFARRLKHLMKTTNCTPSQLTSNNPVHRANSLAFDVVTEKRLDAYSNSAPDIVTEAEIKHLIRNAPEGTRAQIRQDLITNHLNKVSYLSWQEAHIKKSDNFVKSIVFDPYQTTYDKQIFDTK